MSQVGNRYVWGGGDPSTGFDCSGLVQWAFGQVGIYLPHFAQSQYDMSDHISVADLQPGDLVFYADSTGYVFHVAMYIGGGQVVEALNEQYGVMVGSLTSPGQAPSFYGRIT
jgi:cell wall-associated NlpC family hydrolase